jgi:hypothetical protein
LRKRLLFARIDLARQLLRMKEYREAIQYIRPIIATNLLLLLLPIISY